MFKETVTAAGLGRDTKVMTIAVALACITLAPTGNLQAQVSDPLADGEHEPAAYPGMTPAEIERATTPPPIPPDSAYKPAVQAGFEMVARDPTSLLYNWGRPPKEGWVDYRGEPRYEGLIGCVMVRGKNGWGGYAEPKTYLYVVTRSGEAHAYRWIGTPRVGKFISHDPGCSG